MNSTSESPPQQGRVAVVGRDIALIAGLTAALIGLRLVALVVDSRTEVHCDRQTDRCTTTEYTAVATPKVHAVQIGEIVRVKGYLSHHDWTVRLDTKRGPVYLPPTGSRREGEALEFALAQFVNSPMTKSVDFGYGSIAPLQWSDGLALGGALLVLLLLFPAARVVAREGTGELVVEMRPFGPLALARAVHPLSELLRAKVGALGRFQIQVVLEQWDGTEKGLGIWFCARSSVCNRLADGINAALASVRPSDAGAGERVEEPAPAGSVDPQSPEGQ